MTNKLNKDDKLMKSQTGSVGITVGILIGALLFVGLFFINFHAANSRVSGIVYNTRNDNFISGNTTFSVRAAVDTYVSEENQTSYCLPPNSPYIALVNKAADNKNIRVVVEAGKYFAIQSPWTCRANVKVTEQK